MDRKPNKRTLASLADTVKEVQEQIKKLFSPKEKKEEEEWNFEEWYSSDGHQK